MHSRDGNKLKASNCQSRQKLLQIVYIDLHHGEMIWEMRKTMKSEQLIHRKESSLSCVSDSHLRSLLPIMEVTFDGETAGLLSLTSRFFSFLLRKNWFCLFQHFATSRYQAEHKFNHSRNRVDNNWDHRHNITEIDFAESPHQHAKIFWLCENSGRNLRRNFSETCVVKLHPREKKCFLIMSEVCRKILFREV